MEMISSLVDSTHKGPVMQNSDGVFFCEPDWNFEPTAEWPVKWEPLMRWCDGTQMIIGSESGSLPDQHQAIVRIRGELSPLRFSRNLNDYHDDVIKWKHFPRYWPFVWGIHRSPVNSPHKGQWHGALMFSLICPLNKRLSKQSWGWWFETPSSLLWYQGF